MKAQEIESQVGSQRLDTMSDRWRSLDQPSPPISGRSTPTRQNTVDSLGKYHTVSSERSYLLQAINMLRSTLV